jgi:phosphohistidine swiveling domain-containing protein
MIPPVQRVLRLCISAFLLALAIPVWALTPVEVAKLIASDGAAGDDFGKSVAVDGDTVLIGAPYDDDNGLQSGSAYIFTRRGGVWTERAKLTASDATANDFFGYAVALDGDTALIGAAYEGDNGIGSGSAYVFTRSGGVWAEQAKLTSSDAAKGDNIGLSVVIDGDTALIGTPVTDDSSGSVSGAAYVFTRNAEVWTQQAKLTASDAASGDCLGFSVALAGDTALIGAMYEGANGFWSGSAYVFTRSAAVWTEQAKLTASDGAVGDNFGWSVALSDSTALIGAHYDGDSDGSETGSAYVFTRNAGVWTQQAKLTAADASSFDYFGEAVAIDGDAALIGANGDDDNGMSSGSAYIFTRSGGVWTEQAKLTSSDAAKGDNIGLSVVIDGDTALIGTPVTDDSSGSVYIFSLNAAKVVPIDIKPGTETNSINPNSNGRVAVAILTAGEFDALQLDPDTAKFGPSGAIAERYKVKDVDRDGDEDLLLYFRIQQTGMACNDTQATLVGELYDGSEITGTDSIATVGCIPGAVIEAESMALSGGYAVEDNAAASGGQLIRRRDAGVQPATASTAYSGRAGVYDIEVAYFDESDGRSSLAFLLNGQPLDQWIADEDPACRDCASPNESTLRRRVLARSVLLSHGDEFTLQGTSDVYEYARFDNIAVSPAGLNTLEAEDMILDGGFVVEANTAASGGLLIRGNAAAPGKASAAVMGSKGTYDITVAYFDEYDGTSSMAVYLNDRLLEQWLADENPACRECASPNERTLRSRIVASGIEISPGDEIRLESTVNGYEYGRFDKIDFTPRLSP